MKKPLYILGVLTALLLTGCKPNNGPVDGGDTNIPNSEQVEQFESFWGSKENQNVRKVIEDSIKYDIPYYDAPKYVAELDPTNGPLDMGMQVSFVGYEDDVVSAEHCDKYVAICDASGYRITKEEANDHGFVFEYYLATKKISDSDEIILTIVAGGLSPTELGFAVFGKRELIEDPNDFPNNVVKKFLGYEIPEITYPDMTFTYYNDATYYHSKDGRFEWYEVYIEVYGGEPVIESEYYAILQEAGYTIEDGYLNQEEGYKATSPDGTHGIQFLWVDNPRIHDTLCILTFKLDH